MFTTIAATENTSNRSLLPNIDIIEADVDLLVRSISALSFQEHSLSDHYWNCCFCWCPKLCSSRVTQNAEHLREQLVRIVRSTINAQVFTHVPIGIGVCDENGHFLDCNNAYLQLLGGYTKEELFSQHYSSLFAEPLDLTLPEQDSKIQHPVKIKKKDEGSFYSLFTISQLRNSEGDVSHIMIYLQDISEKKALEQQVQQQKESISTLQKLNNHELRNTFTAISGDIDRLQTIVDPSGSPQIASPTLSITNTRDIFHSIQNSLLHILHLLRDNEPPFLVQEESSSIHTDHSLNLSQEIPHDFSRLKGKKVLIVEDVLSIQKMIKNALCKVKMLCEVASNGREAIQKLEQPFDIIITDINMPVMDGIEEIRWIRTEKRLATPILVLTGNGETSKQECFAAGANDYAIKPIQNNDLYRRILKLLDKPTDLLDDCGY